MVLVNFLKLKIYWVDEDDERFVNFCFILQIAYELNVSEDILRIWSRISTVNLSF